MVPRRRAQLPVLLCSLLAGCGGIAVREASPADRCATIMQEAMPNAEIEITAKSSAGDSTADLNTVTARAQGTLKGAGGGTVGMDCVFHNGVLTSIRWTAGPEL
jgi:hypothetical protein